MDDNEDESASGSFNIASLVDSSRKFRRNLGRTDRGGATHFKPVRIGSVTKNMGPARRFMGPSREVGSNDFHRKMSDIVDEEEGAEVDEGARISKKEADLSLSEAFLDSLRLDTPADRGRKPETKAEMREETLPGLEKLSPKVSPDSGSFTMTQPETHRGEQRETGVDFTENLPDRGRDRPVRMGRGGVGGAPVRMNFTGPVRINQDRSVAGDQDRSLVTDRGQDRSIVTDRVQDKPHAREQDKENLPHHNDHGGAKPKFFPPKQNSSTSRIRERLQLLSGSHTNTAPLAPLQSTHSTPTMPPQPILAPNLPALTKATTLPPKQMHTPIPSANPAHIPRPEPAMPPPSMSISQQSREQVLVVRGRRYKVMKLLGKGGSSRVYEAFDEEKNVVA